MTNPIKILFLSANPENITQLDLDREVDEIKARIRSARYHDRFELIPYFAARPDDLQDTLLTHSPQILHFSGHGSPTRGIFLENNSGSSQLVSAQALAHLLAIAKENLRVVVLNACYSSLQAEGISQIVDVTIGMRHEIGDLSAIKFASALYGGLANGRSVQRSFDLGLAALDVQNIAETHIPVLLPGLGVNPSEIFFVSSREAKPESQPEQNDGTMRIDVIVLQRGTNRRIKAWRYATGLDRPFFITLDGQQKRLTPEVAWRDLALEINQMACNKSNNLSDLALDVFLVFRGRFVENYDCACLEEIARYARDYTWASNIYIVWDQKPETKFDRLYTGNEMTLEEWFRMLIRFGVTDLIEIPKKERLRKTDPDSLLRDCALKSERRRRRMRKLVSNEGSGIVLRDDAFFLEEFLNAFAMNEVLFSESQNLVVFYDQRPKKSWGQLVEKSGFFNRSGIWFVAALCRDHKDFRDLEQLWKQESNKAKPRCFDGIFVFNGIFEWLYALIRLKQAAHPSPATLRPTTQPDVEWLEPDKILIEREPGNGELSLLVTSTFVLSEENAFHFSPEGFSQLVKEQNEYCISAAKEIGAVLRKLSFNVAVEVHHCLRSEQVSHLLKDRQFTAWLFLGHRNRLRGVRKEYEGHYAAPENWLYSFELYGTRNLQLVIFSSYASAAIARRLAASGARVAVGFQNETLAQASRELSAMVMPAALEPGDRQSAVISALTEAQDFLQRIYSAEKNNRDTGPTVFAVKTIL
jgi:CHAT domain-containing protein